MGNQIDQDAKNGPKRPDGFDTCAYLKAKNQDELAEHRVISAAKVEGLSQEQREAFEKRFGDAAKKIADQFGRSRRYVSPNEEPR